jgi:hypothetical protein
MSGSSKIGASGAFAGWRRVSGAILRQGGTLRAQLPHLGA